MKLNRLSIVNYKNIHSCELVFSPKINCFVGNNGMGKTNLMDAIYYLSFCKSHTNSIDSQVIHFDADFFVLQGFYDRNNAEEAIYCGLKRHQKKQFKRNKSDYAKLSDHIGLLPLVLVSPSDAALIQDGSDERRKLMDSVVSQYDKGYLQALILYNKALQGRNSLLKNECPDPLMFDLYEEEMVQSAELIHSRRLDFIHDFLPVFQHYYGYISLGREQVGLEYHSHLNQQDFAEQLRQTRQRDLLIGFSTKGIHKDDLEMTLDSYPIKRTGSQGQNKTYLVALKLAQFDFLKKINGFTPILLLDDIFDKLDASRVNQIIRLVSEEHFGQIFIADTNSRHLESVLSEIGQEHRVFEVKDGDVSVVDVGVK